MLDVSFRGLSPKRAIIYCLFSMCRLLCLGIAKVMFRLQIEGEKFVPRKGPAILAANHVSYIDPVIIGIAVRRPIHFMAKKELFRFGVFGWLLRRLGAFPVNRHRINLQAFKQAASLLKAGEIVAIFPEGTRGDGVQLRPAKPGIGLIAAQTGVPVIPVWHRGTAKALPRGAWLPRPHRITVRFGAPFRFSEEQAGEGHGQAAMFSQTIMAKIAALESWSAGGSRSRDDQPHGAEDSLVSKQHGMNERI